MGCLCSHLSSFSLDAVGVVACPSKASFPFTTSTSLSAPHVASETIEVRQGGLLPDFLCHLGPTLGPERTHSDLEFLFLLTKLEIMWKMGVKDSGTRAGQGHRGVWSSTVFGILITIKFGKKTVSVLTFRGIVAFDSLWSLWPAPKAPALCPDSRVIFLSVPT